MSVDDVCVGKGLVNHSVGKGLVNHHGGMSIQMVTDLPG